MPHLPNLRNIAFRLAAGETAWSHRSCTGAAKNAERIMLSAVASINQPKAGALTRSRLERDAGAPPVNTGVYTQHHRKQWRVGGRLRQATPERYFVSLSWQKKKLVASTKPSTLPQSNLLPWKRYAITPPFLACVCNASVI